MEKSLKDLGYTNLHTEDAGDKFGFGFMAHRLAIKAFKGAPGAEIYIQPQAEAGGAPTR